MYSIYFKSVLINLYNNYQRQASQNRQLVKVDQIRLTLTSCRFGQGWSKTKSYFLHNCGLRILTVSPILNRVPFTTE